jgi:hypothetical protein
MRSWSTLRIVQDSRLLQVMVRSSHRDQLDLHTATLELSLGVHALVVWNRLVCRAVDGAT